MFVALHTYFRIAAFMYAGAVCCMSFYDNIIIVVRSVARTYKDEVFCQFVFFALCVYAYRVIECCTGLRTAKGRNSSSSSVKSRSLECE